MASPTKVYMTRIRMKQKKAGRKRKTRLAKQGSTPSRAAFFGNETKA